jgi:DNA-binding transcriptional regulator LsrR (DeoR family)
MNNAAPFEFIQQATREKHWLHFTAPWDELSSEIIRTTFDLDGVQVTLTDFIDDVAQRAAYMILDLLRDLRRAKSEVHIGFSGGHTTRKVFRKLAYLLTGPADSLPDIVCHALVAGFDMTAPGTDPTSFFTYLADQNTSVPTSFVLFHAPPIVPGAQMEALRKLGPIQRALNRSNELDLIVTSAAVFSDPHSQLKRHFEEYSPETVAQLERDGCIGDMLWLPINKDGPIDTANYAYRPVTVIELSELPKRINRGQKVLLVLGPCADPTQHCDGTKTTILSTILNLHSRRHRYVTHLVVDRPTAKELIQGLPIILLTILSGPDDPPVRNKHYQNQLREFAQSLHSQDFEAHPKVHGVGSANEYVIKILDKRGYQSLRQPLGAWLQAKVGRAVRLKSGEFEERAQVIEELDKALECLAQTHTGPTAIS